MQKEQLLKNVEEIEKIFKADMEVFPLVISVSISEDCFESKSRYDIIHLLESDGKSDYIGIKADEQEKIYHLLSTVETCEVLRNIQNELKNNKELLSFIKEIKPFKAECDTYEEKKIYRVSLLDYRNSIKNQTVQTQFQKFCSVNGINILKEMKYSSDLFSFMITVNSEEDMKKLCHFKGVASVKKDIPII